MGWTKTQNLSYSVRASSKEDSQRTTTLTDNKKRETTKTKDLQCMKTHALASTTLTCSPNVSSHFTHCLVSLCTSCRQFNCCRCNPSIQFLTCTRIPCRDSHCENGFWRCCLYTPRRLQQTAVSCKRSNCNKIENNKKSWKSLVWSFIQIRQTTGFSVLSCRFACILIYRLSLNYYELHQESLHCHQLEEELDDWCRCWYFQNGVGLSCRSPDSWCRRSNVNNASLKSERFLNGPVFPDLSREIHQFCLFRKYSTCVM